jgi:hypothetical protein
MKMKKLFVAFAAILSAALVACGPSKLEIQEMSAQCDVIIEVRQVLDDSISLMVGNTLYLNAKQTVGESMFPLSVSTRDPQEIERLTATDLVEDEAGLLKYLRFSSPDMVNFGIVIGETAKNEIGFDESKVVNTLKDIFVKVDGGTLVLFHEKGGEITDAKKLF